MHIPNIRRKMPREGQPQRNPPGPVPTLGELQAGSTKWVWAICNGLDESGRVACLHRAPLALAPLVIHYLTGRRNGRWAPGLGLPHSKEMPHLRK